MDLDRLFKKKNVDFDCYKIDLFSASDKELVGISDKLGIALALEEMKRIREYFKSKRKGGIVDLLGLRVGRSKYNYKTNKHPEINRVYAMIIEAKASLQDFKNGYNTGAELTYIIAPRGVIPHELIPDKIGLIEVDMDNYGIKVKYGDMTLKGIEEVIKAKRRLPKLFGECQPHKSQSYLRWGLKAIESVAYRSTVNDIFNKEEIKIIKKK